MHELSISRSIAATVRESAAGRPVERVNVELGQLRQIVPETLRHCWTLVVEGTDLEGSTLEITEVPAALECRSCGARFTLRAAAFRCERCGSREVTIASGEEFMITSYDVVGA
ncbi:MAG: hydrogenase maturation nickel metallochaperone HypA [Acidimicrobiales bacterium]|nr:hydrogenase maturation nickel metallochaperone HypA [Actinomycetota bacterium]